MVTVDIRFQNISSWVSEWVSLVLTVVNQFYA